MIASYSNRDGSAFSLWDFYLEIDALPLPNCLVGMGFPGGKRK